MSPGTGPNALSEADIVLRLKRWLVYGIVHLPIEDELSRSQHMFACRARRFTANPAAADLARLPAGLLSDEELACLR